MTLAELLVDFCSRLDSAGIRYVVGGSFASSSWGEPRQTNDLDVEIWLEADGAPLFRVAFQDPYLVSQTELAQELDATASFRMVQVMHTENAFKFDCFLSGQGPIDGEVFAKAVEFVALPGKVVRMACAEHILVRKLQWFELGNRVSERQWDDMTKVAKIAVVDWDLALRWSEMVGVRELAEKLRDETA